MEAANIEVLLYSVHVLTHGNGKVRFFWPKKRRHKTKDKHYPSYEEKKKNNREFFDQN